MVTATIVNKYEDITSEQNKLKKSDTTNSPENILFSTFQSLVAYF